MIIFDERLSESRMVYASSMMRPRGLVSARSRAVASRFWRRKE